MSNLPTPINLVDTETVQWTADNSNPRNVFANVATADGSTHGAVLMTGDFGGSGESPAVVGITGILFEQSITPTEDYQAPHFVADGVSDAGIAFGHLKFGHLSGGVDARSTTTETVDKSSFAKLVSFSDGSPAADVAVALDSTVNAHFWCFVRNATASNALNFTPSTGSINTSTLVSGSAAALYFDGTTWTLVTFGGGGSGGFAAGTDLAAIDPTHQKVIGFDTNPLHTGVTPADGNVWQWSSTTSKYELVTDRPQWPVISYPGKPSAGQIFTYPIPAGIIFPANFATPNSYGYCAVNPTISAVFTVYKYSGGVTTTVGTVTISTSGVFTFATTGGTSVIFNAGDVMLVVAPGSQDATLANLGMVLVGQRSQTLAAGTPVPILFNAGTYVGGTPYFPYQFVYYTPTGSTYICILATAGTHDPTNATYWQPMALAGTGSVNPVDVQTQAYVWCGTAGGSANALTLSPSPALGSYGAGRSFEFKASADNTTAVTVNVSSLGTRAIVDTSGAALTANALKSGCNYRITDNGTAFQLMGGGAGGGNVLAKYILGDSSNSSDLTNKIVFPSLGVSPDIPPTSPNALDDEFDAGSLDAKWTWFSQGSDTVSFNKSWMQLYSQNSGADTPRGITQPAPATPWEFMVKANVLPTTGPFWFGGIVVRDSATGRVAVVGIGENSGTGIANIVLYPTSAWIYTERGVGGSRYYKLKNDGTNLIFSYSWDGCLWRTIWTGAKNAWVANINQIGLGAETVSAPGDNYFNFDFFRRTL